MKKILFLLIVTSFCHIAKAGNNKFTFNIRTYTTNVYVGVGLLAVYGSIIKDDEDPLGSLFSMSPYMFAIPIHNTGNDEIGDLKSPYRRCLKAPWKDLGDYKVGLNLSYDNVTTPFGFYIGCDYKSVEVPTNKIDHRTHYISPNAGLRLRYGMVKQKVCFLKSVGHMIFHLNIQACLIMTLMLLIVVLL